ncbi:MAG: lyase [Gemmatimonadaceae bacterium]|nr:lyase [Gemmatimonadaceae bacterium]
MLLTLSLAAVTAVAPIASRRPAVDTITIREWSVPWDKTRPRDPYVAADGRIWFCGQAGNYIAVLDPRTGNFKRYELSENTNPHNLIIDKQGFIWYSGNVNAHIGKLDPRTGEITRFPMPDPAARDPHTLIFDKAGNIWFTVQNGAFVGHLDTKSGKVRLVKMEAGSRPYGIVMNSRDEPYFNLFGTNRIGTIDPKTMTPRTFALPNERARGRRIAITSNDDVWYVDYTRGFLGRLTPSTGAVHEYPSPGGPNSLPYALTVDDHDRLWYSENAPNRPNRIVGFDPRSGMFVPGIEVPSGGQTVRHMIFHRPTRSLWFGTDANTLARVTLP